MISRNILFGVLLSLLPAAVVQAADFDADVVSGISASITEGKTLEDHQPPPTRTPIAQPPPAQAAAAGLTYLSDNSSWQTEMANWRGSQSSNLGLNTARNWARENPWPGIGVDFGGDLLRQRVGQVYFPQRINLYNTINTLGGSLYTAGTVFNNTVNYTGRSMQIMNPPIFLQQRTPDGWKGAGVYTIPSGQVAYKETLVTGRPDAITRVHTDTVTINTPTTQGVSIKQVTTRIPVAEGMAGRFERYVNYRFPTGSYWDVQGTQKTITNTSTTSRETIVGGYKVGPGNYPSLPTNVYNPNNVNLPTNYGTYGTGFPSTYSQPSAPMPKTPAATMPRYSKFGTEGN
jgi:hypothetical protein